MWISDNRRGSKKCLIGRTVFVTVSVKVANWTKFNNLLLTEYNVSCLTLGMFLICCGDESYFSFRAVFVDCKFAKS
jgi:hypothetical protein